MVWRTPSPHCHSRSLGSRPLNDMHRNPLRAGSWDSLTSSHTVGHAGAVPIPSLGPLPPGPHKPWTFSYTERLPCPRPHSLETLGLTHAFFLCPLMGSSFVGCLPKLRSKGHMGLCGATSFLHSSTEASLWGGHTWCLRGGCGPLWQGGPLSLCPHTPLRICH